MKGSMVCGFMRYHSCICSMKFFYERLVVLFPGTGYLIDMPLQHGARKTALNPEMDVLSIPYGIRDDATPDMQPYR